MVGEFNNNKQKIHEFKKTLFREVFLHSSMAEYFQGKQNSIIVWINLNNKLVFELKFFFLFIWSDNNFLHF